jgi:hypothetical protein
VEFGHARERPWLPLRRALAVGYTFPLPWRLAAFLARRGRGKWHARRPRRPLEGDARPTPATPLLNRGARAIRPLLRAMPNSAARRANSITG